MWNKLRQRIARTVWVQKKLTTPVNFEVFKKKPTPRFIIGMVIIGFSYLMAWPLISLFGILAVLFKQPLLFVVGSPIVYGISYLVFFLGIAVAGKETIVYLSVFLQWGLMRGLRRLLGPYADSDVNS